MTLPRELIKDLDALAGEADITRSDLVSVLLQHSLGDEELIDELFPEEEEEAEEPEEEEPEDEEEDEEE